MLSVWQRYVTDDEGNVIPNPTVEVRDEETESVISLYEDIDGNTPIGNPFTGDSNGFARFYAAGGRYQVKVTKSTDISTFENVRIGTATGSDLVTTIDESSPSETEIPSESAIVAYGQRVNPGNTFNVLDYIHRLAGGPTEIDKIISGDYATQDASVVTEGVQNAFVDWYESGAAGTVYLPPGSFLLNDEMTGGTTSSGKTVAEHAIDGDLGNPDYARTLGVKGEYKQTWIIVDNTFSSTDSRFIDSVVLRWELPAKRTQLSAAIQGLSFWANLDRTERHLCPGAIKLINVNFGLCNDIIARGKEWEWPNTGVHIENINNSYMENHRIRAGYQATLVDMYDELFDVTTTTRIASATSSSPFANPAGESDSFWNDKWLMIADEAGSAPNVWLVKTASTSAKVDDNNLDLDASFPAPATSSGVHACFDMVRGSITSGDNTLSFNAPVPNLSDLEGRVIHLMGGGIEGVTERSMLSAYIQPGSAAGDNKSCSLVQSDGTTAANAEYTVSGRNVIFNPGWYVGQTHENVNVGQNNDTTFSAIHVEKSRGSQIIMQNWQDSYITSGKGHGHNNGSNLFEHQFTESGFLVVMDSCRGTKLDNFIQTSGFGILGGTNSYAIDCVITGGENEVIFGTYTIQSNVNRMRLFALYDPQPGNYRLTLYDGEQNAANWSSGDRDVFFFGGNLDHSNIFARGELILNEDGSDLLAPYQRTVAVPQTVTISAGEISPTSSWARVETEGGASTDDVDTISGLIEGQTLMLNQATAANTVVLKHNTGNMLLPGNADITLNQTREIVQLIRVGSNVYVVASPTDL